MKTPKPKADLVIENASELCTLASRGKPLSGKSSGRVGAIVGGFVAVGKGRILAAGTKTALNGVDVSEAAVLDARGKTVLPGFVDAHTHLAFAGSREEELEMKIKGIPYLGILKKGGGILKTVRATRQASKAELIATTRKTLGKMLSFGTTTVEAKSGYGLDLESELKILNAIGEAGKAQPVDVIRTFLGAHAVPPLKTPTDYANEVIRMLPEVKAHGLAEYCDVFCEKGVFSVDDSRRILRVAKSAGFRLRIHADEFAWTGGAELAAEMHADSADHLICASENGIKAMAKAGVTAVFLPCTSFSSMLPYANARMFIDSGVPIALATDYNPNCLTESMPLAIAIGCRFLKITPSEALAAATINAAHSLGRAHDIGSIEVGKKADLVILDAPNHKFLPYHFGTNPVETVIKNGRVVKQN